METLNSIIEKNVRAKVDEIETCNALITAASEDPKMYDGVIDCAAEIVADLIGTNFRYLIKAAAGLYQPKEEEEAIEEKEHDFSGISSEDAAMLEFING